MVGAMNGKNRVASMTKKSLRHFTLVISLGWLALLPSNAADHNLSLPDEVQSKLTQSRWHLISDLKNDAKKYDGQDVAVVGYLTLGHENDRLYMCKDYADYSIPVNRLAIVFREPAPWFKDRDGRVTQGWSLWPKGISGIYAVLVGKYQSVDLASDSAGNLTDVSVIYEFKSRNSLPPKNPNFDASRRTP